MLLNLLVWFEHTHQWVTECMEVQKQILRNWLGPSPQNYYLLENGDILPTHIQLPKHIQSYLCFDHSSQTIVCPSKEDKLVRLPWLTIQHVCDEIHTDLTDIICEIRCTKEHIPTLLQTVRLAALLCNEYLSESNARLIVTNNCGEEEVYEYKNSTTLERV